MTITSNKQFTQILQAAGDCVFDAGSPPALPPIAAGPRAMRILRDPVETGEDQFQYDVLESFFIDELGGRTKTNRFMAAFRCSQGFSLIVQPADGRTFRVGNSIPIRMNITDAFGTPVNTATTAPHHMVATIGFVGDVLFALGTPGNSPNFFNLNGPGDYRANLDTTGLAASPNPYNLCVTDSIDLSTNQTELPLYPQQCVTFFLK